MRLPAILLASIATLSPCHAEDGKWIAVVAPGLQEAITPLVAQRKADGWQVTTLIADADPAAALQTIAAQAADGKPCCVLLAGDCFPGAGPNRVPAGTGIHLRMKGRATDLPWSAGAKGGNIEVGRLPARNAGEMATMVRKILAWPADSANQEAFPRVELIAGHHGAAPMMAALANGVMNTLSVQLVAKLPPAWRFDGVADIDGSPWKVSTDALARESRRMMTQRATFLAYMGHSSPNGAISRNTRLLSDIDWSALPPEGTRPGLFFTCGCYACELTPRFESYGFVAIRSPGGPPAVIGSHGETWSAMGYLAISGLIERLAKNPAPIRLGTLWHGVQQGLATGRINAATFKALDMADGTEGKVPLDQQRREHLESWMLLGDPAMPLLPPLPSIQINPPPASVAGMPFPISGKLPENLGGAEVRITLERQPSAVRTAVGIEIASATVTANSAAEFSASLDLPSPLPAKPWTLRVETLSPSPAAGVLQIK